MPQLRSGRHVGLCTSPYLDAIRSGPEPSTYFAIVALRIHAPSPAELLHHTLIVYFHEDEGTPPDAPAYRSGYCVGDILDGRSDWSADEVAEFRAWLKNDQSQRWLQAQFDEIDQEIRDNPIWDSYFVQSDDPVMRIKRAVVLKSASEPTSMTALRRPRTAS